MRTEGPRDGRPTRRRVALGVALLVALLVLGAAVGAAVVRSRPAAIPDGCGHDLAPFRTTVTAVRADTGAVVWRRDDLPLTPPGLTWLVDGRVRLVLSPNRGELLLDPATGATVEERPPGSYELSIPPPVADTAPPDTGPSSTLPERPVVVGDRAYVVSAGALVAVDRPGGTVRWRHPLDAGRGHSFPLPVADLVIIAQSDAAPGCA